MSFNKILILFIVTISVVFSHNLYGYLELTFNKLTTIAQPIEKEQTPVKKSAVSLNSTSQYKLDEIEKLSAQPSKKNQSFNSVQIHKCPRPPLLNTQTKTYFVLNTNLGKGYEEFLHELTQKLNAAFKYIENHIGISLNRAITLNIVFQTTREDYENYLVEQGASPEGNQGIYLASKNLSIVELKNNKQGIKTAIHEAIHAFNNAYWGNSLRFFNEGMAEHLESISIKGEVDHFNFTWIKHQQYGMQISTLLFSNVDWHGDNRYNLYQNSKALFHFLMSNIQGRKVIWEIMKREMKEPCNTLPNDTIEEILFEVFPNHQQAFDYWFMKELDHFLSKEK